MFNHPVLLIGGIIAAVVYFGGVDAGREVVDNTAHVVGATIGLATGGIPDLIGGFNEGRVEPGDNLFGPDLNNRNSGGPGKANPRR